MPGLVINSGQLLRTVVASGGFAELLLSRTLWKNDDQDIILLLLNAILPLNRQSKEDGREKTGTEFNDSKALNKTPPPLPISQEQGQSLFA